MFGITQVTEEINATDTNVVPHSVLNGDKPVILRGLIQDWPLVSASKQSAQDAIDYLRQFYNHKSAMVYRGPAKIGGRYFYNQQATGLNYTSSIENLDSFFNELLQGIGNPSPPSLYLASNPIESHFPTMAQHNALVVPRSTDPDAVPPIPRIWMGNKSLASCHFDTQENIACCVAGKRRLALFPPEQIENLYPGPLELTPGGQVISMVDFYAPDHETYPKFKLAQAAGQLAELNPGDAIYIPAMWWHQVEGLSAFNLLVNYWWSESAAYQSNGMSALLHAILSIRYKTPKEKAAWKALFDYYIFSDDDHPSRHLPDAAKGLLANLDERQARQLRAMLVNQLNR